MGHSYKGAAVEPGKISLWKGPVLITTAPGTIAWTPGPGTVKHWVIWKAVTPSGPWEIEDTVSGSTTGYEGMLAGDYCYVQGTASDKSPLTQQSNTVLVESEPSAPVLTDQGYGTASWTWGLAEPSFWWMFDTTYEIPIRSADHSPENDRHKPRRRNLRLRRQRVGHTTDANSNTITLS